MVTVTGYREVEKTNGETFISLELSGGLELVQSQTTGNFYATVRKVRIPSTFDETVAEMMIGQQIEGSIERVTVEPYNYVNKTTGEVMTLQHSYVYRPKGSISTIGETRVQEMA